LAKDPAAQARLDTVLYHLLEGLRWLAVLLRPALPDSSRKMAEQLGLPAEAWEQPFLEALQWGELTPASTLKKGQALFPRLE
jgi:methionyl-tRNA synthetase